MEVPGGTEIIMQEEWFI